MAPRKASSASCSLPSFSRHLALMHSASSLVRVLTPSTHSS
eukprot:CAMPEP_0173446906 /NCGR_PEP_ID=MMETSP1357-20121228/37577_1 /TAXON_ID=77926 /ORGANISM="Hemiselmis rufescens, Strain PCC563" /LENGTH=40 /DNA_ID= /DNA_START= /DNA_END= /DNA_ORIENTATION=